MSLLLSYKKLFRPYTRDGHTLEAAIRYWKKEADRFGLSHEVMELAINEIFNRIANGYVFPMSHCPCGCGIDKAATALLHAVRDRMLEISDKVQVEVAKVMESRYALLLEDGMKKVSKTNKQYVKMMQPPLRERSPVLRGLGTLKGKVFK